jgi:hypothetical protein
MIRLKLEQRQNVAAGLDASLRQLQARIGKIEDAVHTNQDGLLLVERTGKARARVEDERLAGVEALVRQVVEDQRALSRRFDEQATALMQISGSLRKVPTGSFAGEGRNAVARLSEDVAALRQEQAALVEAVRVVEARQRAATGRDEDYGRVVAESERHGVAIELLDKDMRELKKRLTACLQLWNDRSEKRINSSHVS